jgi:hypothetical protein
VRRDSGLDQPTQELAGAVGGIADETLCLSASVFLLKRLRLHRRQSMSKKAAESHKKASEHLTHAAHHHTEAAKHHETGQHEKAAHHAHIARAHATHAREHSENAAKAHLEEHGKK